MAEGTALPVQATLEAIVRRVDRLEEEATLEALLRRVDRLEEDLATTQQELTSLKQNLHTVFYPAVLFGLLETAVKKTMVKYGYPDDGRFLLPIDRCARSILAILLLGAPPADAASYTAYTDEFNSARGVVGFPPGPGTANEKATRMTKAIHLALCHFLNALDRDHFASWPPDRNPLMHNGLFLDALYGRTPGPRIDGATIDTILNDIDAGMAGGPAVLIVAGGCEKSIKDVKDAMSRKGLAPRPNVPWGDVGLLGAIR